MTRSLVAFSNPGILRVLLIHTVRRYFCNETYTWLFHVPISKSMLLTIIQVRRKTKLPATLHLVYSIEQIGEQLSKWNTYKRNYFILFFFNWHGESSLYFRLQKGLNKLFPSDLLLEWRSIVGAEKVQLTRCRICRMLQRKLFSRLKHSSRKHD